MFWNIGITSERHRDALDGHPVGYQPVEFLDTPRMDDPDAVATLALVPSIGRLHLVGTTGSPLHGGKIR